MQKVTSNDGTEIAWYDFGGSGPDLLLAHATGFCGRIWQPIVEHLKNSFRCVSYDLRGHGLSHSPSSAHGSDAWDWERYADDALAVIAEAGLKNPYAVGHSCGGATEVLAELRRPGTFKSLFLFEPVIFTHEPPLGPDTERDLAIRTLKRRRTFDSKQDAFDQFSTRGPFKTLHASCLNAYLDYAFETRSDGSLSLRCKPEDEAQVYIMATAHTAFSRLNSLQCPTVVIHGQESRSFTEEHMRKVAERIPQGRFKQRANEGHFGPLEHPEEFANAVKAAFLN